MPQFDERAVDVALRDGRALRLRAVRADDEPAIRAMLERLDPEDRMLRFFSAGANLAAAARSAADVDERDRWGIVAVAGDDRTVLAHGCAIRTSPDAAEVAFVVDGALRGEGIATTMLAHLAERASAAGVRWLTAVVLPENHAMIEVFRESGLRPAVQAAPGELRVTMPAQLGVEAQAAFDARDAEAAANAVGHVLRPRSLAIVGASERPGSVGGAVLRNVVAAGWAGPLHVVNRRGGTVGGRPALRSVEELPEGVDLVVVAIPADGVLAVAEACARRGVRALLVLSDGFGEAGPAGRRRQQDLVTACRRAGIRLVGPNCLGVLNTDPAVGLDATFAPELPPAGRVAFLSQSGALGIAVIDTARELGVGLSSFVSVGDKADLSGNDFLSFWERDPDTDVVLLYLESFGNPRKFSRVARRVARSKPIVAVKGGRSAAGAQAAGSHTGALLAGSDATVQALFRQAGVIATDTLGELFDVAALLATQPPPRGRRVGIVTNGGGLGILCADACATAGLDVVELPAPLRDDLAMEVGEGVALRNPLDLLAAAAPRHFERAIARLGASGEVDAVIALYVPPMVSEPAAVAAAIAAGAVAGGVPTAAVLAMSRPPMESLTGRLPVYRFPENAARAVAHAAGYGAWRARDEETGASSSAAGPPAGVDAGRAAAAIARALRRAAAGAGADGTHRAAASRAGADGATPDGAWLEPAEVAELLDAYGIPRPAQRTVTSAAAAGAAARELGGAVALKAVADGLVHRSDVGAVEVGLASPNAVVRAGRAMHRRLEAAGMRPRGFVVQAMATPGVELLAGVVADPTFGPVVACAAGGTTTELLGDPAVRLTPLAPAQARELVHSLRIFPLLDGFRGAPRCDVPALEDLLLRLATLADAHPEIAELECNPVIVGPDGAVAVDARARVHAAPRRPPEPALRAP